MKKKRKKTDWESIYKEYRAGQLSIREIAKRHDISNPAIVQRAKRDGWERDLSAEVRREISRKISTPQVCEAEIVDEAVSAVFDVVECHRKDVKMLRGIIGALMLRLDSIMNDKDVTVDLIEASGVTRNIAQAMAKCIPLERLSYSLPDVRRLEHTGVNGGPQQHIHLFAPDERKLLKEIAKDRATRAKSNA